MPVTVKGIPAKDFVAGNGQAPVYSARQGPVDAKSRQAEIADRDLVFTWPHLFMREMVMTLAITVFLTGLSLFWNAPLEELANPGLTPNPAKAPWYFLNLQELLHYFAPMWAGVFVPGLLLVMLMAIPYIDRNPSLRAEDRPLAISLFSWFVALVMVITLIGTFFRGPGWEWAWPWLDGIFTVF